MDKEDRRTISFPVFRITQPIGDFFIGAIEARALYNICKFDLRTLVRENAIDTYMGIQRKVQPKRKKEIMKYVNNIDATFPTCVILSVEERCASLEILQKSIENENIEDGRFGILTLSNYPSADDEEDRVLYSDIARIIDGQHRIAGLENYDGPTFEINVAVFVGPDIADQAAIFSTVNLAQTKVNRSLVYDLFSLSKTRSPEKTSHEIVVTLDQSENSPFYHRIKRLGVSTEGRFGETLSQATFVNMLLRYLSLDPAADREALKRGRSLGPINTEEFEKLIFRNMFIKEKDVDIVNIIWNYFDAVKERWPAAWAATGRGNILNRTNGFRGFMRFLRPAYLNFTTSQEVVTTQQFLNLFQTVQLNDDDFNTDRYPPGTSGETALSRELLQQTNLTD